MLLNCQQSFLLVATIWNMISLKKLFSVHTLSSSEIISFTHLHYMISFSSHCFLLNLSIQSHYSAFFVHRHDQFQETAIKIFKLVIIKVKYTNISESVVWGTKGFNYLFARWCYGMNMSCTLQPHVLNSGSPDGGVAVRGYEVRLSWRKQITGRDSRVGVLTWSFLSFFLSSTSKEIPVCYRLLPQQ